MYKELQKAIWVNSTKCRLQTDCRPLFSGLETMELLLSHYICMVKTMVCSSLQSAFSIDRFLILNRFLFSEEKKCNRKEELKHWPREFWSPIAVLSKRILNVDLSYLPKCTEFFQKILENKKLFQYFSLNRLLYRGGLTGKF